MGLSLWLDWIGVWASFDALLPGVVSCILHVHVPLRQLFHTFFSHINVNVAVGTAGETFTVALLRFVIKFLSRAV